MRSLHSLRENILVVLSLGHEPEATLLTGSPLLNFGIVADAIVFVLGVVWCRQMLGRWRHDLEEFRTTTDNNVRLVLAFLWGLTAVILVALLASVAGIIGKIGLLP